MALLDVLFNRLWNRVSKLSPDKQRDFAIVIGLYDFCRERVSREFVSPLCSRIARRYVSLPRQGDVLFERLLDESVMAVLRSCTPPDHRSGVKLTYCSVTALPEVLGVFALCDANHRAGRYEAQVLKDTRYSCDPDEARTQLMLRWMELCGITDARFVRDASDGDALEIWRDMTGLLIAGGLRGIDRSPDTLLLSKGKELADSTPAHRRQHVDLLIQRLASATEPVERSPRNRAEDCRAAPPEAKAANSPRASQLSRPGVPERWQGSTLLTGRLTVLQEMFFAFRFHMNPEDKQIAEPWVAIVVGKPVRSGVWEPEHDAAFVRGVERMIWEGGVKSENLREALAGMRSTYRQLYPEIEGTELDVNLSEEMRNLYARMLGQVCEELRNLYAGTLGQGS